MKSPNEDTKVKNDDEEEEAEEYDNEDEDEEEEDGDAKMTDGSGGLDDLSLMKEIFKTLTETFKIKLDAQDKNG